MQEIEQLSYNCVNKKFLYSSSEVFIETNFNSTTFLQIIQSLFIESKITPGVCPGTKHTDPLMPIGGYPANTMASQGLSWDWWGRSQVQKMGVERPQVNFSQSILQIEHRGNYLQIYGPLRKWVWVYVMKSVHK